jgi:hypothetical protein
LPPKHHPGETGYHCVQESKTTDNQFKTSQAPPSWLLILAFCAGIAFFAFGFVYFIVHLDSHSFCLGAALSLLGIFTFCHGLGVTFVGGLRTG